MIKTLIPTWPKTFCWIHGSNYFPEAFDGHLKCAVDPTGRNTESVTDTSYYQWVTMVLFLQAIICIIPYKIWKLNEGGLIKSFGTSGTMTQMDVDEMSLSATAQSMSRHFFNLRDRYTEYFSKFFIVEITFFLISWGHFFFIDWFLDGNFLDYGSSAVQYYGMSPLDREHYANPLCSTFPTEVSCTVPTIGSAGTPVSFNSMCVLSQNIVNEKMYVFIWFWLIFLMILSTLNVIVRIVYIVIPSYRAAYVSQKVSRYQCREIKMLITKKLKTQDAFILSQLAKNMDPALFDEFIHYLLRHLDNSEDDEEKALCTTPC
ncbi:inx [Lepeophtheirus salmonis]|uniref:Innexin n=1 Tax=Lepeophtheirus salmonis TaxID=72036 RepID=A0A7R8H6R8_LEPSM|nr:inx [Lepeophtheirus salmonis]CAF2904860.1 inx [Lepeophtheirus salmonis]